MSDSESGAVLIHCPHQDAPKRERVCLHLLEGKGSDYYKRFTGEGFTYVLLCERCIHLEENLLDLRNVCTECRQYIEDKGYWEGVTGRVPRIQERSSQLTFEHRIVTLPDAGVGAWLDIQPVTATNSSQWVLLTSAGELVRVDPDGGSTRTLAKLLHSDLDLSQPTSINLSADAGFAAVTNTHGQHGCVIDLGAGKQTLRLDRGDSNTEHSIFPVAFFDHEGRTFVVHATDWNRLDISDPNTGRLLTEREPTSYWASETRPDHYLDYFHGRLTVSPDGNSVADTGWEWHPAGVIRAWNLKRWLRENVWESEDGASVRKFCLRLYHWDAPLCWLSNEQVAVWGYGRDEEWLIPAVTIFDATIGKEVGWFPGPQGTLAFDTYLFSFSPTAGMAVWDVGTGERILQEDSFAPTCYHPIAREFLTLLPDNSFQLSRLHDADNEH